MTVAGILERILLRAVPGADREAVLGDLTEEAAGSGRRGVPGGRLGALVGIVSHYQIEPYRDAGGRLAALGFVALGLAVLWLVSAASGGTVANVESLYDPVSRVALRFWTAPEPIAAAAAGLLLGRIEVGRDLPVAVRWHAGGLLAAAVALAAPTVWAAAANAGLLLAGVWLGNYARLMSPDRSAPRGASDPGR